MSYVDQHDEAYDEAYDDEPLRWYVIGSYVLTVVAGFAVAVWCTVSWYSGCDEGRHVSPFTAGDSLRGTLCDAGGGMAVGLLVPAAWVVGLVLATLAMVRWGGGPRTVLLAVLLVTPVVLPPAAYAGLRMSGTTCTGHELAAYREWADAGSKGAAPYDCRTF